MKIDRIVCINLKSRKDKRAYIKKHIRKKGGKFKFSFFYAILHKNSVRGCLESHLSVIKQAQKDNLNNILILEDDVKFLTPLSTIYSYKFPSTFSMLYLGGNISQFIKNHKDNKKHY